jgi:polyglutamine-binding protein 1
LALAIPQEDDKSMELSDRDRLKRARTRGLDPMDPAAYGDAPEGKWAAGIASEAKTGVDVTATY